MIEELTLPRIKTILALEAINNTKLFEPIDMAYIDGRRWTEYLLSGSRYSFSIRRDKTHYTIALDTEDNTIGILIYIADNKYNALHTVDIADPTARQQIEIILTTKLPPE